MMVYNEAMKNSKKQTIRNRKISQGIMSVLAVFAALAGVAALADLSTVPDATRVIETWRMIGYFTFAALFSLLASAQQNNKSLWIIVIANKVALAIAGLALAGQPGVTGASDLITFDGMLAVFMIVASILAGVWQKPAAPTKNA